VSEPEPTGPPVQPDLAGYRMPPENAPHERTLISWPCRRELWGDSLDDAKREYAGVANAVAAFEPVTVVASTAAAALEARTATGDGVDVIEIPLDDSWVRDNGPLFVTGGPGGRIGVHFRFNAWGEKFDGWDRDQAAGGALAAQFGSEVVEAPLVLEGGSFHVDSRGRLVTTEQCLLQPNRNPQLTRDQIEQYLRTYLGVTEIVWFGRGLVGDRDTDGHVDMFTAVTDEDALIIQSRPPGDPDHRDMAENRLRAESAGFTVIDFPHLAHGRVGGEPVMLSYLNLYLCNGGAVVPIAGGPADEDALTDLRRAYPDRKVVGVPALTIASGGGGPHCITQQVPQITPPVPRP
jgi:agmatine deiminase